MPPRMILPERGGRAYHSLGPAACQPSCGPAGLASVPPGIPGPKDYLTSDMTSSSKASAVVMVRALA